MIIPLLLGLTGILAGIALSFIAPEEIKSGWKYFKMAKFGLFAVLAVLIGYSFWIMQNFIAAGIFAVLAVVIFIINLKFRQRWLELINYLLFITPYFFQSDQFQIITASLLFLYGLPAGTLLWNTNYETET